MLVVLFDGLADVAETIGGNDEAELVCIHDRAGTRGMRVTSHHAGAHIRDTQRRSKKFLKTALMTRGVVERRRPTRYDANSVHVLC
jgi:hypothetical protein